jgi:hypothetical protein
LRDALTADGLGLDGLSALADRFDERSRREAGYQRDEALRCARAVRAFQETFNPRSFGRYELRAPSRALTTNIEGVRVNVTLDALVSEGNGDATYSGGIVLLYAFSVDRGSMRDRLSTTAGMILWALEAGQMEPLPRLCMAADLADRNIVKASPAHGRFRARIADSCREIAALWGGVEPPSDYDGPDWRS